MTTKEISGGVAHEMPADLRKALRADKVALEKWESLTPLARNEWLCWIVSVMQSDTRKSHVERTITELVEGKRRPCCWLGCIHRTDKALSPSQKYVISKRTKAK
jgi:uncharacterized protein YdeI (YjbR/CyaY-like superfamily)